jgi:hypothetical protein
MARRSGSIAKYDPLTARQLAAVASRLTRMCSKLRTLITYDLTQDDISNMFIKPEHIEVLTAAGGIAGHKECGFKTKVGLVSVNGELELEVGIKHPKYVLPKYMGKPVTTDFSLGEEKIVAFVRASVRLADEFHLGIEAIHALNKRCENLMQMRFFLKCLPALGVECKYRVPSDIPDIPRELRLTLRSVDEFVARASMLPDFEEQEDGDVTLNLSGVRKIPTPWKPHVSISYYI